MQIFVLNQKTSISFGNLFAGNCWYWKKVKKRLFKANSIYLLFDEILGQKRWEELSPNFAQ